MSQEQGLVFKNEGFTKYKNWNQQETEQDYNILNLQMNWLFVKMPL